MAKKPLATEKEKFKFSKDSNGFSILCKKHQSINRENSLEEITKRFLKYIIKSKTNIFNINDVVDALNIKKRRIYDVTNVLEGKYNYIINI